jgi:hypothetical protein
VEKAIVIDRLYHKGKEKKIEKLIKKGTEDSLLSRNFSSTGCRGSEYHGGASPHPCGIVLRRGGLCLVLQGTPASPQNSLPDC